MMNTLTGGCNMPRQMLRWLDSLDLSFTVRNPRIDLANGFIIAEIISRYFPKQVNIYSFYNNQAKDKRINNWEQIQKVLLKKNFHLSKQQFESLSNLGPNAGLDLIYRLYEFLTGKKIKNDNRTIQIADDVPLYMKPTASYLAKDRQLQRIVDNKQKQSKTKKTIESHLTRIKNKKYSTGLIQWLIAKRKFQINQELKRQEQLLNKKTKTIGIQPKGQIKQIQLKCFNEGNRNNRMKTKNVIDFLLDSFSIYLKKDFIIRDIRKLGLELKQKDNEVNVLNEIFHRSNQFQDERRKVSSHTLEYLIKQLNEPAEISLVFENIHNNFIDFKKYFSLFVSVLKTYDENQNIYKLVIQLIFKISSQLIAHDPDTTQTMFSELILEQYMGISKQQPSKTRSICEIILSFSRPTTLNQYQMLIKVRQNLAEPHEFIHYLSYFISIILIITEQIEENLWNQCYEYAMSGINSASNITRTNSLKIISQLVMFSDENFFVNFNSLTGIVNDSWWEVRALGLIVFSRLIISRKKGFDNTVEKSKQIREKQSENKQNIDYQNMFKQIVQYILRIFHIGADEKILRVGLIELAELLNYQNNICGRYLQVLLSVDQHIISDVLNTTQNKIGVVSDQKNTFEYRLTGAAAQWNPVGILLALHQNLEQTKTKILEQKHINIILSCLKRNQQTSDKKVWSELYQKLKPILFQSIKSPENTQPTSDIIHQFFQIANISQNIMTNSKQNFKQLLSQVYFNTSTQRVGNTILKLFKNLSTKNKQFMQYVYQILKQFSEIQRQKYLNSNLVEFMNDLARKRRERLYSL